MDTPKYTVLDAVMRVREIALEQTGMLPDAIFTDHNGVKELMEAIYKRSEPLEFEIAVVMGESPAFKRPVYLEVLEEDCFAVSFWE